MNFRIESNNLKFIINLLYKNKLNMKEKTEIIKCGAKRPFYEIK